MSKPCLAITLVNPREPQLAGSYHWCTYSEHEWGSLHACYCGILWITDDLLDPTPQMIQWRSGNEHDVKAVSGRMLG